jgi:hypothetical protein
MALLSPLEIRFFEKIGFLIPLGSQLNSVSLLFAPAKVLKARSSRFSDLVGDKSPTPLLTFNVILH